MGTTTVVDAAAVAARLDAVLLDVGPRVVACSGGVDSLLLSFLAARAAPEVTIVAHAVTPAVPPAATARVIDAAAIHGWQLELVRSAEFSDERYLSNPQDRCYFCKTNLYEELERLSTGLAAARPALADATLLSGANVDDLGEYRPGLRAAAEHAVRHPYVEAGVTKAALRALAASHGLSWAELPSSPCLASRLYTGTRVTPERLHAVDVGEELLRRLLGVDVVRCRLREDDVHVEVLAADRPLVTAAALAQLDAAMRAVAPSLGAVVLDEEPYAPGRSFLPVA